MKYKIAGILACAVILFIALIPTPDSLDGSESPRVHQHLQAKAQQESGRDTAAECSHGDDVLCTHLPLVVIDISDDEIPGDPVHRSNGNVQGKYTVAEDGESTVRAEMRIMDNEGGNNHVNDEAAVSSLIDIRKRGNSSRHFDKKSYDIKLVTAEGENNPQEIMGMDSHHRWVLYGPYLDKTLLRNYMAYNIAGEIMDYAPNVRFCELVLDGEYRGLYLMTETITAGDDGSRLNISVNKKNQTFSGYILRLDRGSSNPLKNIDNFSSYTRRTRQILNIEYPGTSNLDRELAEGIRKDFSRFEKALYSYDFDDRDGYRKYIDAQSFADYFIINEFSCNYDAGMFSTYIYKEADGKLKMCVWDFNSAWDNYQEAAVSPYGFQMQNRLWYFMLTKDEDFVDLVIDRYRQLRKTYLSDDYIDNYIDETVEYLGDAIDRNYQVWGYTFGSDCDLLTPKDRNPGNYEEAIKQLKDFVHLRGRFMDENIESLRQYCAESRTKKFKEDSN